MIQNEKSFWKKYTHKKKLNIVNQKKKTNMNIMLLDLLQKKLFLKPSVLKQEVILNGKKLKLLILMREDQKLTFYMT